MKKLEEIKHDLIGYVLEFLLKILGIIIKILRKFIKRTPTVYTCMSCNKEYDKPQECSCGSTRFIYNSRKYKIEDGKVTCGCGKGDLEIDTHYDCDNGFAEDLKCTNCRNRISIHIYMDEEDYAYDDEEMFEFLSLFDDEYPDDENLDDEYLENLSSSKNKKIIKVSDKILKISDFE